MLFTVLRTTWARPAISKVAFRNAAPTVSSLLAARSFLTTAHVNAAAVKKATSKTKTAAPAKQTKVKKSSSKASKAKNPAVKEKSSEEAQARAQARKEKALIREKEKKAKEREKKKRLVLRQKALDKKAADKLAKQNARKPIRRPLTAYTNYISQTMVNLPLGTDRTVELAKAGHAWRSMSDAEKQKYEVDPKLAEEYQAKIQEWKASLTRKERSLRKKNTKTSGLRGYNVFVTENFPKKLEGVTFTDTAKALRARFAELSVEEKEVYRKRAEEINAARKEEKAQVKAAKIKT